MSSKKCGLFMETGYMHSILKSPYPYTCNVNNIKCKVLWMPMSNVSLYPGGPTSVLALGNVHYVLRLE